MLPGHLLALEHAAAQEFFPLDQAGVLEAFLSRLVQQKTLTISVYHIVKMFNFSFMYVFVFQTWQSLRILLQCQRCSQDNIGKKNHCIIFNP